MTPEENLSLVYRVLRACRSMDDQETVRIGTHDSKVELLPYVIVSDVFAWGCADSEDITLDNVHMFEQAVALVIAVDPHPKDIQERLQVMNYDKCSDAGILFASKVRGQRPFKYQGTYPVHASVAPLIEALPFPDNTRCGVPAETPHD